jgi:LPS-assembly lipoprotein
MNKKNFLKSTKYLFLILLLSWLPACGFKMYDKSSIPIQLYTIYLQSQNQYGSFTLALKQALKSIGINITQDAANAPIILNISNITINHDNPNISPSSQATIYNFTYSVVFELQNKAGQFLVGPQTVRAIRALTLNPNELLDASSEVKTMQTEMERELIMQIFDRLNSNNVRKALSENKTRTTTTTIKN